MPAVPVHFTATDLARTRLAPGADRQWETRLSLQALQSGEPAPMLEPWRSWAWPRLGHWARPLLAATEDLRTALEPDESLARASERYHQAVIAPVWPTVTRAVAADRAARTRTLSEGGLEGLLGTLAPTLHWRTPVLTSGDVEAAGEWLSLRGRGLVLVGAYFCTGTPVIVDPPTGPVVLIHPLLPSAREAIVTQPSSDRRPRRLDALMGSTRAAVLQALADGCTTKELADRVGVSPASASQHATVLREAGLISTQRQGPSVLHVVTALGSAVLTPPV